MHHLSVLLSTLLLAACTGTDNAENRTFAPKDVEFSVTFPGTPTLSEVTGKGGWFQKPTTLQVATRGNQHLYLKAEATKINRASLGELSPTRLIDYGISYGNNQGFDAIEVTTEERTFGPCHTVRGTKRIEGLPYVFLARTCFGGTSMITQYIVAPPTDFPPPSGIKFLQSLAVR